MIRIEKLTDNHNLTSFDCGDVDLNEFLTDDAIPFQEKRIATTYIVIINDRVAAYFSLLNDKVSRTDVSKSAWRKLIIQLLKLVDLQFVKILHHKV